MNVLQARTWLPEVLVPFFTLSYPTPRPANADSYMGSNYYETGLLDGCFVLTWILVLGVLRECLRLGFLEPFGRQYLYHKDILEKANLGTSPNGHTLAPPKPVYDKNVVSHRPKGMSKATWRRERSAVRFAEQGWQFAYYIVYWPLGLYIHWGLPSAPFRLEKLWINYPHVPLAGPVKFYYLTQLGFWCHQVLLLNAEAWRKDHFQMMSHHVITIVLVIASYSYNFTRVGVLVMVLMDWCDIFLAAGKICRYLTLSEPVVNSFFAVFALSWVITRHLLFGTVIYSAYRDAPVLIPFAWEPKRGHYYTLDVYRAFVSLMIVLQFILCIWLAMLMRIFWNVLMGNPASDTRSDDEGEDDGEDDAADVTKKVQ